jgi:hypothetical protein
VPPLPASRLYALSPMGGGAITMLAGE